MKLGREKGERLSALVVTADSPLTNAVPGEKRSRGEVRILADAGGETIYAANRFRLNEKHWAVTGMELQVRLDASEPDGFEIDWDSVPSIEDRAAANDPTLVDPIGTRRKVTKAMQDAGVAGTVLATADHFAEAMERAANEPAKPGTSRAVVLVATHTATLVEYPQKSGHRRDTSGKQAAVLSVNVPGQAPYAVFKKKLKFPDGVADLTGAGFPALVSSQDPTDVEILWDEAPSAASQVGLRISDSMEAASADIAVETQMREQIAKAMEGATPPATPAAGMPQLGGEMQSMMAANAKRALQFVQDPAQRKMLIEQYRAAGIEIDEDATG